MKRTFFSLLLGLCLNSVIGQSGNIDTSFHIGTGFSATVTAIAQQPDHKIIIGGLFTSYNGTNFPTLVRINPNGTIDSSFNIGATGFNGTIKAIHVFPDTSMIVVGGFSTLNGINMNTTLVKLDKNGTIDGSFNPNTNINGAIFSLAVDTNSSKIYIGGIFTSVCGTSKKHLARLNLDGTIDNSFDIGTGITGLYGQSPVYALKLQADSNILVGGDFLYYKEMIASKLCRIKPNGNIDTSFANNLSSGFDNIVYTIDQMADGKIIVGGDFTVFQGSPYSKIACLNMDGTNSSSFNIGAGVSGTVYCLKSAPNNKILVGGSFNFFNNVTDRAIIRINATGSRDANFATGTGLTLTSNAPTVYDVLVQSDSAILVGGYFDKYQDSARSNIVRIIGKGNSVLSIPTLTTTPASLITNASARLGGEIIDNGNSLILERGACWSTSINPTISDNFASTGTTNTPFSVFTYNLSDSTTYYVRAYARNSEGIGYGDQLSFKTRSNENYTCGEVTFTYNGFPTTYGTIKGKYGRCWLDRNLGASRPAEAISDVYANGDLFQWGRQADGHQIRTSGTVATLASNSTPGHSDFITVDSAPFDWMSNPNNDLWANVTAENNPCPTGWRIPTASEFTTEMSLWELQNTEGAFLSALRIPASGMRSYLGGTIVNVGDQGAYWTSEASTSPHAELLSIENTQAQIANSYRALGASVRCIKDYSNDIQIIDVAKSFQLFPNPANNSINIQISNENLNNTTVSIFDNTGRVVYTQPLTNKIQILDISQIPSGIYFVKIQNNKNQQVERLIITK